MQRKLYCSLLFSRKSRNFMKFETLWRKLGIRAWISYGLAMVIRLVTLAPQSWWVSHHSGWGDIFPTLTCCVASYSEVLVLSSYLHIQKMLLCGSLTLKLSWCKSGFHLELFFFFLNEILWQDRISEKIFLKCRGSLKAIKHLFKYCLLQQCPMEVPVMVEIFYICEKNMAEFWVNH